MMKLNEKVLFVQYDNKIINFVNESDTKPIIEQTINELSWLQIDNKNTLDRFDNYKLIKTEINENNI